MKRTRSSSGKGGNKSSETCPQPQQGKSKKKSLSHVHEELHRAINLMNATDVKRILAKDEMPCTTRGQNCFYLVNLDSGRYNTMCTILKLLIEENPSGVDALGPEGETLLMRSVDRIAIVETLLGEGANPHIVSSTGKNFVSYAVLKRCLPPVFDKIKGLKVDVDCRDENGETPIFYALKYDDMCIADQLLNMGCKVNVCDNNGYTPLMVVCGNSSRKEKMLLLIIMKLLVLGADPHTRLPSGENCLHFAVLKNRGLQTINLLISKHVDVSAKDGTGKTPLFYAKDDGILQLLLDAGADPNVQDSRGKIPLMYFQNSRSARILLQAGANPNVQDPYGKTPLMCCDDSSSVYQILLRAGADPLIEDKEGHSALYHMVHNCFIKGKKHCDETFKVLLQFIQAGCNLKELNIYVCYDFFLHHCFVKSLQTFGCKNSEVLFSETLMFEIVSYICLCENSTLLLSIIEALDSRLFDFTSENPEIVPPISTFLLKNMDYWIDNVGHQQRIAAIVKLLVKQSGVNIERRILEFCDKDQETWSNRLHLTDSLWAAIQSGNMSCVHPLIPYWPHPPLALLLFFNLPSRKVSYQDNKITRYKKIKSLMCSLFELGGPVPVGSDIFYGLKRRLQFFSQHYERYTELLLLLHKMHSEVPSLLSLSRIAIRATLKGGRGLFQQCSTLDIPETLKNYLFSGQI